MPGLIERACDLASLAYRPMDTQADAFALATIVHADYGLTLRPVFHDAATDSHAFLATDHARNAILAFRGTASLRDCLIDAEIIETPYRDGIPGAMVHAGFAKAYCRLQEAIRDSVCVRGYQSLTLVGHSLGGALATLAAVDIATRFMPIPSITLVTFGSPRVGNAAFASAASRLVSSTRVVHDQDIVPKVPDIGYEHLSGLLHLDDEGHEIGPVRSWWARILGWDRRALSDLDGVALGDHHIAAYARVVKSWQDHAGASGSIPRPCASPTSAASPR